MVSVWLSPCWPGFVCEALELQSLRHITHTSLCPYTATSPTGAPLPPPSLIVLIEEYSEEEAPKKDTATRLPPASGTSGTSCPGPAECGALQSRGTES